MPTVDSQSSTAGRWADGLWEMVDLREGKTAPPQGMRNEARKRRRGGKDKDEEQAPLCWKFGTRFTSNLKGPSKIFFLALLILGRLRIADAACSESAEKHEDG